MFVSSNQPFSLDSPLTFSITSGQTVDKYQLIQASDAGLLIESTQPTFNYQFTEPGLKKVLLYGYIGTRGGLVGTPKLFTFDIKKSVTSVVGTNPLNMTGEVKEFQEFGAIFDNVDDKTLCVEVSYGDGIVELYGERDACKNNVHYDAFSWVDYLDPVMTFDYPYDNRGIYEVKVKVISDLGTLETTIAMIAIGEIDCNSLIVTINSVNKMMNNSECLFASDVNVLTSTTEIMCQQPHGVRRKWTVYDQATNVEVKLDHTTSSQLTIPAKTLGYGQYVISYEVEIIDAIPEMLTVKTTQICAKPNSIIPKIIKGDDTHLFRGVGESIELAPALYSVDPELNPGENPYFDVVVLCRSVTNNEVYPVDPSTLTGPVVFTKMLPVTDTLAVNNGGCFGKGPGVIDFGNEDLIDFNTANFVDPSSTYEFTAVVRSYLFNFVRVSVVNLKVSLIAGSTFTTYMRFLNPEKRIIRPNGNVAVNTIYNIGFLIACEGTCNKDNKVLLNIDEMNGAVRTPVTNSEFYYDVISSSYSSSTVVLVPGLFTAHSAATSFILKASYESSVGQSCSEMEIYINHPPDNLVCNGDFYTDANVVFARVTCNAVSDPDGDAIDSYVYYSVSQVSGDYTYYKTSRYPSADVLLKPNDVLNLYVDVMDAYGAATTAQVFSNYATSAKLINVTKASEIEDIIQLTIIEGKIDQLPMIVEEGRTLQDEDLTSLVGNLDEIKAGSKDNSMMDSVENQRIEKYLRAAIDLGMVNSVKVQETLNFVTVLMNETEIWASSVDMVFKLVTQVVYVNKVIIKVEEFNLQMESVGSLINSLTNVEMKESQLPNLLEDESSLFDLSYRADFSGNNVPAAEKHKLEADYGKKYTSIVTSLISHVENTFSESDAIESEYSQDDVRIKMKKSSGTELPPEIYSSPPIMFERMNAEDNSSYDVNSSFTSEEIFLQKGIYVQDNGLGELIDEDTPTLTLRLFDKIGQRVYVNLTDEHLIFVALKRKVPFDSYMERVTPTLTGNQIAQKFAFDITGKEHVYLVLAPDENVEKFIVAMNLNKDPSFTEANEDDVRLRLSTSARKENGADGVRYTFHISKSRNPTLFGNDSSRSSLHLAVAEAKSTVDLDSVDIDALSFDDFDQNLTSFSILTATVGCAYYNVEEKEWKDDGIKLDQVRLDAVYCASRHMTTFGSGFFIKPNTIDFDYVLDNAEIDDNLTIYLTITISMSLYLILLVWSRWKDKKDVEKLGASPLPDNNIEHSCLYEILVFTGTKWNSGTDSKIKFVLSGDFGDSGVRALDDPERRVFQRSSVDSFVMTTPKPLGDLLHLRVWHDNGGKGKRASWYLDVVVVRDLQTGRKYEFIAHRWFAVEYDDGMIDRTIPVSGLDEMSEFSHLFKTTSSRGLRDGHLWLSVFLRPPHSRFTRMQRVTCCMSLLYLSMLVNIMWYGSAPDKPGSGMKIGPFSLSPAQIGVGLMSNAMVFIPSLLIVTMFRRCRPRKLRPSRITEALEKQKRAKPDDDGKTSDGGGGDDDNGNDGNGSVSDDAKVIKVGNKDWMKNKKSKNFTLPWWCVYVAWFLAVLSIGSSVFFLWAYGIQFGNEKTAKWFTSLIISTLCSIFLTQPIKVMLTAIFLSMIFKDLNYDENDAEQDEEEPHLKIDEEWLHTDEATTRRLKRLNLLSAVQIQRAREQREKEMKMYDIAKEIVVYLTFLTILLVLSYDNRDPNMGYMRLTLHNILLKPGDLEVDYLKHARNTDKFYEWLRHAFLPELIVQNWYNRAPPVGLGGLLDDRANYVIGIPLLRQIRVKENACVVHRIMRNVSRHCGGYGRIINEDNESYRNRWSRDESAAKRYEFQYQHASTLKGLPYWGVLDWYGGGGYVYPILHHLRGKYRGYHREIERLEENDWIDERTRAVFVELSVYNAQVNLFATVNVIAEFLPGGGIIRNPKINVFRLQRYHTGFGFFVLFCEVVFVAYVAYYSVHEVKVACKQKRAYFGGVMNVVNLSVVLNAWLCFVFFIWRELLTLDVLDAFAETQGRGYVRLQHVAQVDEIFGYFVGLLVFLANLKFLHLLRFNKRLGIIAATIKGCAAELSGFALCLLIIFLAFVQLFFLILGLHMADYASFISSVESSFSMMLGKFDFNKIRIAAPLLGPAIFFVFGFATTLIMLNLLLTIVIRTFDEVKSDMSKMPNDYEMVEFIVGKLKEAIGINTRSRVHPESEQQEALDVKSLLKKVKVKKVDDFAGKVDKLVDYIDNIYLDGEYKESIRLLRARKREKPQVSTTKE
ncbi:Uncharacterised protein g6856 [Pycnogonum litorale]